MMDLLPIPAAAPATLLGLAALCVVLSLATRDKPFGRLFAGLAGNPGERQSRQHRRPGLAHERVGSGYISVCGLGLCWLTWLAGTMLWGPGLGLLAAAAATTVRLALAQTRLRRRRRLISTGVGSLLRDLYLMASGGDTAARCLSQCIERASEPVRSLIAPALIAVQTGRGLYQALADIAELTTAAAYRDLLQIAWLHSETGASFASMLAENVERREESAMLLGELDAKMGEARWTARILAVVPVAVAAYTLVFSPFSVGPMLADPTGRAALVIGSGLWAAGLVAVWRMQIPPTGLGVDE